MLNVSAKFQPSIIETQRVVKILPMKKFIFFKGFRHCCFEWMSWRKTNPNFYSTLSSNPNMYSTVICLFHADMTSIPHYSNFLLFCPPNVISRRKCAYFSAYDHGALVLQKVITFLFFNESSPKLVDKVFRLLQMILQNPGSKLPVREKLRGG